MSHKILFTASTFSHIANFHRPYLAQFARLGWEVHVACGGPERDIPEAQRIIHIPLEKSMTSPKNWKAVRLLRRMVREEGYALVSCHTSLVSFFTRLAVMGLRERPLVACTSHGYLFDGQSAPVKRALLSGAERITAPVTDLLMTMNDWDGRYAQKHRLGRRTVQIPGMGVDFSRLDACPPEEGAALRRDLGLGPERFLFLYAAEFSPRKSQAHLIRALSLLPEAAVLALPGEGALREDCIRLSEELGLGGRVIFPGQVSDMPRRRRGRLRQPQRGAPLQHHGGHVRRASHRRLSGQGAHGPDPPRRNRTALSLRRLDGLRRGDVRPAPGPDMVRPVGRPGP